ncbi:hypothetical protein K1719_042827 [Acacia pycnantha]|nr:hypothetical protein K1719_042827 [Acacia pycnantha]
MVNHMTHILTLHLEENRFSSNIPSLNLPNLQDFNVSRNQLSGEIPKSLPGFQMMMNPKNAFEAPELSQMDPILVRSKNSGKHFYAVLHKIDVAIVD